jgi:hypothetical protein
LPWHWARHFVGYLAWHAGKLTYESSLLNDLSSGVLVVPLRIPQLGFAVGTAILLIAFVDELVHVASGGLAHYVKPPPKSHEEIIERAATGLRRAQRSRRSRSRS